MAAETWVGRLLGERYEVVELIGEGGMARVYRGADRRLQRPVVLKVLKEELVDNQEFRTRFAREASNAARLAHANIVKVHDVDEEGGVPFIVMEYYPAQDLKSILRKVGKLSPGRAVKITVDILDALDYAHSQNIVHRDLKPHNVLITERNEVKITDFGIAKALTSDSLTRTGTMMGTAHYMSPEQAQGQAVGPQTDLYSLGIMLYEMLSGRLPFEGDNPITVGLKHVQEAPPPLASRGASVPPALEDVITTALRKAPAERFRDAQTMRRALLTVADAATRPSPPSNGFPSARPPEPVDETVVRPAIPTPSMPAYSLGNSGEFRAAPPIPPPTPVEKPPSARRSALIALFMLLFLAGIAYAAYVWVKPPGEVKVPSLVGLEEAAARAMVEKLNLRFTIKEFVYSDEQPGIVKSQYPEAGTGLRRGNDVLVVMSKGRQTVQVPSLAGMDRDGARQALEERGLTAKWQEDFSDTVGIGKVAGQEPAAGTPAELRTKVTVTISKGMPQVSTPNLVGSNEKVAAAKAEAAGLKVRVVTQKPSPTVPKGNVMEQSPKAGVKTTKGSAIELIVSSGPEARGVPSLKGLTLADARRNAEQQGFRIIVDGDQGGPDSRVVEQNPEGGATMPQGGVIHVTLDAPLPTPEQPGEDTTTVPNVTRMGLDAARAALEEHGLHQGNTDPEESDLPAGTVIRQAPEEGASVRRGSTVDLVISEKRPDATNK